MTTRTAIITGFAFGAIVASLFYEARAESQRIHQSSNDRAFGAAIHAINATHRAGDHEKTRQMLDRLSARWEQHRTGGPGAEQWAYEIVGMAPTTQR